jgi:hypothetical protein
MSRKDIKLDIASHEFIEFSKSILCRFIFAIILIYLPLKGVKMRTFPMGSDSNINIPRIL